MHRLRGICCNDMLNDDYETPDEEHEVQERRQGTTQSSSVEQLNSAEESESSENESESEFEDRLRNQFDRIEEMAIILHAVLMADPNTLKDGCSAQELEGRLKDIAQMSLKDVSNIIIGDNVPGVRFNRDHFLQLPCWRNVLETVCKENAYLYRAVQLAGLEEIRQSVLSCGAFNYKRNELLRNQKAARHDDPESAYSAKILCNFLCEYIEKIARETNKKEVMFQRLEDRYKNNVTLSANPKVVNLDRDLFDKYSGLLDFSKNGTIKKLVKSYGKRSSIIRLLEMPLLKSIGSNCGPDPERPTTYLFLQEGINVPPYDSEDIERTRARMPNKTRKTAEEFSEEMTDNSAEEKEKPTKPPKAEVKLPSGIYETDSEHEPEPDEYRTLTYHRPAKRTARKQSQGISMWEAEEDESAEEEVVYSDEEESKRIEIETRQRKVEEKRQKRQQMRLMQNKELEMQLEVARKQNEKDHLAEDLKKYNKTSNKLWYKVVEVRQPTSGGGMVMTSFDANEQIKLVNVFEEHPPEVAFHSERLPQQQKEGGDTQLPQSLSIPSPSELPFFPPPRAGSSQSSSPQSQTSIDSQSETELPQKLSVEMKENVRERFNEGKVDERAREEIAKQEKQQPSPPAEPIVEKPLPTPVPLPIKPRTLAHAPPGIRGPQEYHNRVHRPQFPGEVSQHHAQAKVNEFEKYKQQGDGFRDKDRKPFNMLVEKRNVPEREREVHKSRKMSPDEIASTRTEFAFGRRSFSPIDHPKHAQRQQQPSSATASGWSSSVAQFHPTTDSTTIRVNPLFGTGFTSTTQATSPSHAPIHSHSPVPRFGVSYEHSIHSAFSTFAPSTIERFSMPAHSPPSERRLFGGYQPTSSTHVNSEAPPIQANNIVPILRPQPVRPANVSTGFDPVPKSSLLPTKDLERLVLGYVYFLHITKRSKVTVSYLRELTLLKRGWLTPDVLQALKSNDSLVYDDYDSSFDLSPKVDTKNKMMDPYYYSEIIVPVAKLYKDDSITIKRINEDLELPPVEKMLGNKWEATLQPFMHINKCQIKPYRKTYIVEYDGDECE